MKTRAALLVLSILAAAPLALTLAGAQEDDSAEKSAFVRFVEDKISTPDRKIELGAIDGALSSDVRLASITISDREGVWLRIEGVHLVWSRLALLRGNLNVDSLDAERIEVIRKPLPAETVNPAASEGFSMPDLPVAVKVGRLAAPNVVLGSAVLGEEAHLGINASASLASGSLDANLAVRRCVYRASICNVLGDISSRPIRFAICRVLVCIGCFCSKQASLCRILAAINTRRGNICRILAAINTRRGNN